VKEPRNNPYVRNPETDFRPVNNIGLEEACEQVDLLREAINYHDYRYYVKNNPVISDKAYDKLFNRLKELEKEFDLVSSNSPTQRVSGKVLEEFETAEHVSTMLSLNSSENKEDILSFDRTVNEKLREVKYHCEPKFDGVSVEIVYENGEFERAVTRGNGIEGDDISENVKTIREVPLTLVDNEGFLAVRGEIYISKEKFQSLNKERLEKGKEPFSNPRNAVAGTIRQLNQNIVANRPLQIFFYSIIESTKNIETQKKALTFLEKTGFKVNDRNILVENITEFIAYRNQLKNDREDLKYDIDGAIAKVNEFKKQKIIGETSVHPRWAYAYKMPAKTGKTTVREITVQVGRTGKLTPVVLFDPVNVKGVTISRATLHNEKRARELNIKKGSKIEIERAGDVIPEVKKVIQNRSDKRFKIPSKCPACNSNIVKQGKYHFCTGGNACPAQLKKGLQHFASKEAMDIRGIGETAANQLVEKGLVKSLPELYTLEKSELNNLEAFGEKSSDKLVQNIRESKEIDLASFLTGLGIRHVGKETARTLAENFNINELKEADKNKIEDIESIGPETADSIFSFFNGNGGKIIDELLEAGIEPEKEQTEKTLKDVKIVITGSIEDFTREELSDLLEYHGADLTSSVSSETDYLVVGENPGANKLESAEEHNVEAMDEQEFTEQILETLK